MSLKNKITMMSQGVKIVTEFLNSVKCVFDELAMVQAPVPKDNLIICVLNGLSSDFQPIATAIRARHSLITFKELSDKLMDFEQNVLAQKDMRFTKYCGQCCCQRETKQ